jgi:hypothetical protein
VSGEYLFSVSKGGELKMCDLELNLRMSFKLVNKVKSLVDLSG